MNRAGAIFCATALTVACAAPALAQFAPAPDSVVDLSPVVNPLIQALGTIATTMLIPLAYVLVQYLISKWRLERLKIEEQYRAAVDAGAKAAIGGALSKIKIPKGKLSVDVKSKVVDDAANALVTNFPVALEGLGVENKLAKATEIVESRLGLMDAQAAGNPVPNPSQPAPPARPPA